MANDNIIAINQNDALESKSFEELVDNQFVLGFSNEDLFKVNISDFTNKINDYIGGILNDINSVNNNIKDLQNTDVHINEQILQVETNLNNKINYGDALPDPADYPIGSIFCVIIGDE